MGLEKVQGPEHRIETAVCLESVEGRFNLEMNKQRRLFAYGSIQAMKCFIEIPKLRMDSC
jgi:hypothetical protein